MLFGIYGSHTPENCPIYVPKNALVFVDIAEHDPDELARAYGIRRFEARYHSALEHTFLWIVEADDPHLVERFAVETGLASFNTLRIVPMHTFAHTVERLKHTHGLGPSEPVPRTPGPPDGAPSPARGPKKEHR